MTIYASTYGAVGNGVTDDTVALQAAINAAQASSDTLELAPGSNYRITSALVVQQGSATGSAPFKSFDFDGKNSTITNAGSGWAIDVQPLGPIGPGNRDGYIAMRNFTVQAAEGNAANARNGIKIGDATKQIYFLGRPKVLQNVLLYQLGGSALHIMNTAHGDFERVTQRDDWKGAGHGLILQALGTAFTGDISFYDCQFQGSQAAPNASRPILAQSYAASGQSQLRGVRFDRCVVYGSGTLIEASTGSQTNDFWFHDCAWDGPNGFEPKGQGDAVTLTAVNGGQLDKIYFDNPYIVGYTGRGIFVQNVSGTQSDIHIRGGSISDCYIPFYSLNGDGWYLDGVAFTNTASPQWVLINVDAGSTNFKIDGCTESGNGGSHFIAVGGAGTTNFDISNNISYSAGPNVLNDYSGAVTKNIFNNVG